MIKSNQTDLARQVQAYIAEQELLEPGEHWLVAVSGGRDSCVLLHILQRLQAELNITLSVAHFDHQLRAESAAEQEFVRSLATQYGLAFVAGGADVRAAAVGRNLEETGRRERYAFLRRAALTQGAQRIVTAHHAQDQAETLLLHLLRGCGLEGLAAIAPLERDLVRPLLFVLPEQIEAYRALHDLSFCQDETNFSTNYTRNRLRLELLPQLQQYNPRLVGTLNATSDICREDDLLLQELADTALAELWLYEESGLDGAGFDELPLALKRRVLRKAFALVAGEIGELSYEQINAVTALKEEQSCSLPQGWLAYRRGALYISREQPALPQYTEEIRPLLDEKWHVLAEWGWEYRGGLGKPATADCILLPKAAQEDLLLRTRREGDAVASSGKQGQRKLKDIFIDHKIAPYLRNHWPLLLAGGEIVAVPFLFRHNQEQAGESLWLQLRPLRHGHPATNFKWK